MVAPTRTRPGETIPVNPKPQSLTPSIPPPTWWSTVSDFAFSVWNVGPDLASGPRIVERLGHEVQP